MRLARESRYAIEALLVLARRPPGAFVGAADVADEAGLPGAYLHKILRLLVKGGVLESKRGAGYALARSPESTTVGEILLAIEGPDVFDNRCIFWKEECSTANPCELHFRWKSLKPQITEVISGTTLAQVDRAEALLASSR